MAKKKQIRNNQAESFTAAVKAGDLKTALRYARSQEPHVEDMLKACTDYGETEPLFAVDVGIEAIITLIAEYNLDVDLGEIDSIYETVARVAEKHGKLERFEKRLGKTILKQKKPSRIPYRDHVLRKLGPEWEMKNRPRSAECQAMLRKLKSLQNPMLADVKFYLISTEFKVLSAKGGYFSFCDYEPVICGPVSLSQAAHKETKRIAGLGFEDGHDYYCDDDHVDEMDRTAEIVDNLSLALLLIRQKCKPRKSYYVLLPYGDHLGMEDCFVFGSRTELEDHFIAFAFKEDDDRWLRAWDDMTDVELTQWHRLLTDRKLKKFDKRITQKVEDYFGE